MTDWVIPLCVGLFVGAFVGASVMAMLQLSRDQPR